MNRQGQPAVRPGRRQGSSGSLAVEAALVLVILALGLWVVIALVGRAQQHGRTAAFVRELREIEEVFKLHLPLRPNAPLPAALLESLNETAWPRGSALGGSYEWLPPAAGASGAGTIAVTAFAPQFPLKVTRADLQRIDREIDDGDLAGGRFRTGFNGWPVYHLAGGR